MFSFFWRRPPQNEKKAILCEKGAYCELVSSLSSLDTVVRQAPAQQRPHRRQEAQQHKRETAGNGYAYLHLTVEYDDVLAFLPPNLL